MNNVFEESIFEKLCKKYPLPQWVCLSQLRVSTGYEQSFGGDRIVDAFIINMYPSKNFITMAVEFKRTLQDFNNDLRDLSKQAIMRFYSDEFYYLFPYELYQEHKQKLHSDCIGKAKCGIMLVRDGYVIVQQKPYMRNYKSPWSFGFVCSMLRNAKRVEQTLRGE